MLSIANSVIFSVLCKSSAAALCSSAVCPALSMANFCCTGVVDLSAFNLPLHKCVFFTV